MEGILVKYPLILVNLKTYREGMGENAVRLARIAEQVHVKTGTSIALAPQVAAIVVNANQNAERYREFGHPVVPDAVGGYAGPLAGLHAGLAASATPYVATVPCDSPFLPGDLVARLAAGLEAAGVLRR